jgi:N-acetylneuraminic acid mutarotase
VVKSEPRWENVQSVNEPPHRRTGHACATYGEMLYVFGGTDGQYHYNDTWCFDPRTQRWTELQCIGFIPAPREGHSVAVVDDVIYIFGGRGVDGKDLGDLTGFRISSKFDASVYVLAFAN